MVATFHPAVQGWLEETFGSPTPAQARGWPSIQAGAHALIAAPTGSGKTLAAFLCAIDALVRRAVSTGLSDETRVLYVSPLKALGNDVAKNLREPIAGVGRKLAEQGLAPPRIRTAVRSGDTTSSEREGMKKRPPHLLVTTPESLYILLTSEGGRRMLRTVETVIVDEIHAVVDTKRGSHLSLSLERLDALTDRPLQRVGLSATQKPIDEVARFLVGAAAVDEGIPRCAVIDVGHRRALELELEVPPSPLEAVMSHEVWGELYDRIATRVEAHRTSLVFVNTRRLAERLARHLEERLGEGAVVAHHGSLAKEHRLDAEQRLKAGALRAVVATASLELGIDVGEVDLVCQVGSCRAIATLLQRVGRSGHQLGGISRGRLFPLSRDELVEAMALVGCVRDGELDRLEIPEAPLDILAQQIVAACAAETWSEEALLSLVRRAWPYRALSREDFDRVVDMLARGHATRRGRRAAYLHRDAVQGRLRGRRGARLAAITSGGAIPEIADFDVVLEPAEQRVGSLNEDFAIESMAGDVFQLGSTDYRILRVETGVVRVERAEVDTAAIPFWLGEAPGRTAELSAAVSALRASVGDALERGGVEAATRMLVERGFPEAAAWQAAEYLGATRAALGVIPTETELVAERFFDEVGNTHLVIHTPHGSRINRAWGLALRKRFCRTFNFELQAAATEDALVLSLGPTHSFPLHEVWRFLRSTTARDVLVQALLDVPMFETRWRWNATRSLSVLRFRGGKRRPPQLQRMDADDLLTLCFPDQVACLENVAGDREIPDHPLVEQTIADCMTEAMDAAGLERVLRDIEAGRIATHVRDTTSPSPLSVEVLNARPYAFLDDAPLEERRTRAVMSRRWLDPDAASELGALDDDAIDRVVAEAWPEVGDEEELHDALLTLGAATNDEMRSWAVDPSGLIASGRVTQLGALWVAAERLGELRSIFPAAEPAPPIAAMDAPMDRDEAIAALLRSRLACIGPVDEAELGRSLGLDDGDVRAALAVLESEGYAMRGRFRGGAEGWCERRLLARIHRATLRRLRSAVEPVTAAAYVRFLLRWQRVTEPAAGQEGLAAVLEQLAGLALPAASWERDVLPARVRDFDPRWLDALTLSGRFGWLRRSASGSSRPVHATPIAFAPRSELGLWRGPSGSNALGEDAERVLETLSHRGASFFADIARALELDRGRLERAVAELVAAGRIHSDGFAGIRALLWPAARRDRRAELDSAGRWSPLPDAEAPDVERVARHLLLRWGVVVRRALDREGPLPPWRDLVRCFRRLEARGEIRGGRFVAGFSGEQFALPEAVGLLRKARRDDAETVRLGAGDPLNLIGTILPGERLAVTSTEPLLLRGGAVAPEARGAVLSGADAAVRSEPAAAHTR